MSPSVRPLTAAVLGALLVLSGPGAGQEHGRSVPGVGAPRPAPISISREETRDGPRWSVVCEDAPFGEVLRALAKKSALALEGNELVPFGAEVSLDLRRRPLDQVLEYLLGGQGLRHEVSSGTLRLFPATQDPEELLRLAHQAWRVVETAGDRDTATQARLARGNLAEVRGDLDGAYLIYAEIAADAHGDEAHEALFRAGRVLERLGHWAEAAQHFRTLAGLDAAVRFHTRARLELARVSIELGDSQSALHLLNFLNANYPTDDPAEEAERRLVRARAFNATHDHVEALRTLETGEVVSARDAQARSLEIRALAFEGLGYHVEAARAWLIYAREAALQEQRNTAYEKAARLSLEAGDELGTLFVCREAAKGGADEGLGQYERTARMRLGLDEDDVPVTITERLDLAEDLLAREEWQRAAELFEGLYLARGALVEGDRARVLAGWARIVLDRAGLQPAIDVLGRARPGFADPVALQTLDLAAAGLFEAEGFFDEAANAYRGIY